MNEANRVPARAKQAETAATKREAVGRMIWTECMLAAAFSYSYQGLLALELSRDHQWRICQH